MNRRIAKTLALASLLLTALALSAPAKEIPAQLPGPPDKPADQTKPVQVYILAGQSNMVGMGELGGAKNPYTAVYLTSDPAAPIGPMMIWKAGGYLIAPLTICQPDGTRTDQPIAQGELQVPRKGVYQVHCGHGETSYCTIQIDGKQVYSRASAGEPVIEEITLDGGRRYPFTIADHQGDPPRIWMQKMDLLGYGDLESSVKREGNFPWLVDDAGNWTVRGDVYFQEARLSKDGKGSLLSPTSNSGKTIGPELGFGHVLGTYHDAPVLLIKTAQGNRSLGFDFRPPSSGRTDPDSKWESLEYRLMIEGVRKTLENIDNIVPGCKGQGYDLAGFVWWQGHKDGGSPKAEYEKHLVNLINDVRKEFDAPKMPAVVATVGFHGHNIPEKYLEILEAQMAVGDPEQHPEYAGNVASVDTRDFWRAAADSPTNQDYHYNRNAETYMLVGDALGRAMVRLEGGEAEPLPHDPAPPKRAQQSDDETESAPTEQEIAARQAALRPIILDGIIPAYVASPRYNKALEAEATGEQPNRHSQFLRGAMFGLANCYRAAGIDDYDWQLFGPELRDKQWSYFSFDPPETMPEDEGNRYREVTCPDGMENWFGPEFDPGKAGWKKGLPPFGQLGGKLEPLGQCDRKGKCGCGENPRSLWEKEVLLARGTFEFPPLKDGHRYRIVVGGSNHVNAGEGFALYLDGKLLTESERGVGKRQGGQPRGAHIWSDFRELFQDGEATIAVTSFLRYNHPRQGVIPPRGHLTVWVEEQKIPPVAPADE